jgi:orotate phosphoribosyltransferase
MVDLIPSAESVMQILQKTGAYRQGHFVYPNGKHASCYFQMPLAFRFYDNSRVMSVGLSRKFRMRKRFPAACRKFRLSVRVRAAFPVAFAVREALGAEQIYWAEIETESVNFASI